MRTGVIVDMSSAAQDAQTVLILMLKRRMVLVDVELVVASLWCCVDVQTHHITPWLYPGDSEFKTWTPSLPRSCTFPIFK